jgi:hypothetical protein
LTLPASSPSSPASSKGRSKKAKGKRETADSAAFVINDEETFVVNDDERRSERPSLLLPFAFLLLPSLEVALAGVVAAVAVNLDVVLGALAVDAAKLLALLDGAGAGRVPARVRVLHGDIARGLVGHLRSSSRLSFRD